MGVVRQAHPFITRSKESTVIVRHRPDECFRECYDIRAAARVFERWRYLILGQVVSADNSLATNWLTYEQNIANPILNSSTRKVGMDNGWQTGYGRGCGLRSGLLANSPCPFCLERNDTACLTKMFMKGGRESHCLCRLTEMKSESRKCIDSKPPDKLDSTTCIDITRDVKCVYPHRDLWSKLPRSMQPSANEIAGNMSFVKIPWILDRDGGGYHKCKTGQNL